MSFSRTRKKKKLPYFSTYIFSHYSRKPTSAVKHVNSEKNKNKTRISTIIKK